VTIFVNYTACRLFTLIALMHGAPSAEQMQKPICCSKTYCWIYEKNKQTSHSASFLPAGCYCCSGVSGVPRGGIREFKPPHWIFNLFVLCVCNIYCPSPALIFIKSKILYTKR